MQAPRAGLAGLLLCLLLLAGAHAQFPPVPPSYIRHALGSPAAPLKLEMFIDHLCPDSSAAWATLKPFFARWEAKRPGTLQLTVLATSLPYHHNSYYAAMGALLVQQQLGQDGWWRWMEGIFAAQTAFCNAATVNMTGEAVLALMADTVPLVDKADFLQQMLNNGTLDEDMRVAWKYAESRGVWATPLFYMNGVGSPMDSQSTESQWEQYIESLL